MSTQSNSIPFYIVDVFSDEPLAGNPLAVVPEAERLDENTMRRLAREFNQSETTFLLPPSLARADWRLRCFTPAGQEVFGAGHNALGAWWWLAASGKLDLGATGRQFVQEIGTRTLPVEITCSAGQLVSVGMTQTAPVIGQRYFNSKELTAALGLQDRDIVIDRLPMEVVSTGAAHMLVPVRDRSAVDRSRPDPARLAAILHSIEAKGCYLFSLDPLSPDSVAYARFFNPVEGISEDAATGSAAGPLACQLVAHKVVEDGTIMTIEQGRTMGRPSLIRVRVSGNSVVVMGRGVITAEGVVRVP
jgi:trans-2,3-dihydro-3-hydroxyanthranilate isomerase